MDPELEPFLSLGVAVAAGLLIGLERERSVSTAFLGGARTYPLVALLGGLTALLVPAIGPFVVLLPMAGLLALIALGFGKRLSTHKKAGLTSDVALLVTYALGILSVATGVVEPLSKRAVLVAAVAVVTTLLLSSKPTLHGLVERASESDVYALVKFLLVAVVVLPLLPDRPLGPWGVVNPFQVGLLVTLITGLGFAGYVAVRILGPGRGLGLTGLLGGLASSTAVTVSMASRAREEPDHADSCALAILLACTVMAVRIGVLVQVVEPSLLPVLVVPLVLMTLAGVVASAILYRRTRPEQPRAGHVSVENPVELGAAARFAAIFVVVLLATKAATIQLGTSGSYLAGLIGGALDVDAITLSMARLSRQGLDAPVAATTILIGAGSNTLVKAGLAAWLGGSRFGARVGAGLLAMLVSGAVGLLFVWR